MYFQRAKGTFRPERLADIARRYGLNEEARASRMSLRIVSRIDLK